MFIIACKQENGNYFGGKELFKAEYATPELQLHK